MVTGELKSKIDNLWEIFWTGGLTNPLDVIEQMTYLMFIRDLDDADNVRAKEAAMLGLPHKSIFAGEIQIGDRKIDGSQLKWSTFHDFPAAKMYSTMQEWVFPFIKNLHGDKESAYSKYMGDAIFKVPTPLMLDKIVTTMDAIYEQMEQIKSADTRGDVYEYLLSKLATAGVNGQFRTPRHIIRMMVEMMNPKANEIICDPACGTSGFLVAASEYLRDRKKQEVLFDRQNKEHYMNHMFHGYDMDRTMLRIGAMNMMTHGVENPYIEYRDSLSDQNTDKEKYSLILANPPFKGSLDYDIVSADLLKVCKTKKTELLFLALFIRMLKIGGRCACIVPDGVLFGSSTAHKAIRKALVEENCLEAVISMPSGVFKPYAGVSTAILIFTKTGHGGTDKVWFYDMKADGFSLDDKRTETKENDIPDIIERFRNLDKEIDRKRTEQSFFVPKEEIAENGYDLSINKYKEIEYVPVEYPSTQEIMTELHEVKLGDLTKIKTGKLDANASSEDGQYPFFTCSREPLKISNYSYDCECVLVAGNGDLNVKYYNGKFDAYQRTYIIEDNSGGQLYMPYLYYFMEGYIKELRRQAIGGVIKYIKLGNLTDALIELPSVDAQKKIVNILKKAKQLLSLSNNEILKLDELVNARFVEMFGNPDINEKKWNEYKMEQLCEIGSSKRIYQNDQSLTGIPFLRISDLVNRMDTGSKDCDLFIPEELFGKLKKQGLVPVRGDILLTARGTLGRCYIIQDEDEFYFQDGMITWLSKYDERITPLYISCLFEMPGFRKQIDSLQAGSTVAYLSISMTKKLNVMTPPIELQNQFADFVTQVDKSNVEIQKALNKTQMLFDSLMQEYFG